MDCGAVDEPMYESSPIFILEATLKVLPIVVAALVLNVPVTSNLY